MALTGTGRREECVRCVFRLKDDPRLELDKDGICQHCRTYETRRTRTMSVPERDLKFRVVVNSIKKLGRGRKYDCVVGLSGGVDSSYVVYLAHREGLRALIVHLDNGWDTEASMANIENALRVTGFDLHTYVIDWPEFRDLQLAYLKAGVIDIEALTDHAIVATLFRAAREFGVRYILTGVHWATEGILPDSWVHMKMDSPNIKAIQRGFGTRPLKTFPLISLPSLWLYRSVGGIRDVPILDLVDYEKSVVKGLLQTELGWRDYGGKHHESVFTRFYQTYILPMKFGVDKRRSHFSTLICAGQMTREQAANELLKPPLDADLAAIDKMYVARKFGVSVEQFDEWMSGPRRSHLDFASYKHFFNLLSKVKRQVLGRPPLH